VGLPVVRARWRDAAAQETAREAILRLVTGGDLTELGLGRVSGRVDLRGLWLASLRGMPRDAGRPDHAVASDVVWRDVDLSSGTVPIDLVRCSLSNVCLDRVQWPEWRAGQSVLDGCTFARADLRGCSLDGYNPGLQDRPVPDTPTVYTNCTFDRTRIGQYASWGRATFEDCRFVDTDLPNPFWTRGANLIRCRFEGDFREVCFGWTGPISEPLPQLQDVDVTRARFTSLESYATRGSGLITTADQVVEGP
jgi:uncharacterized protein YjbI with pentapeptide repeats